MNDAFLLYVLVDGVPPDEALTAFKRERITADLAYDRPKWSEKYRGAMLNVQTLYGEYGGWLGSKYVEECANEPKKRYRHKWSSEILKERELNLLKMSEILHSLSRKGTVVVYLHKGDSPPGQAVRAHPNDVTPDFLRTIPYDTPIVLIGTKGK